MKYLKKYSCKEFHYNESIHQHELEYADEAVQELKDIALELNDEGIDVLINKGTIRDNYDDDILSFSTSDLNYDNPLSILCIKVMIYYQSNFNFTQEVKFITYDKIKETIERMIRYMESNNYHHKLYYYDKSKRKFITTTDQIEGSSESLQYNLYFANKKINSFK